MTHQELIDQAAIKLCPIGIELIAEPNDLSMSRSGFNTVFHHCDIYQGRPSYASCLHVIELTMEKGDDFTLRPDCSKAIRERNCPAVKMRMEELKAGHALFFVDYKKLMERRGMQAALDRETSPVQFRRKRSPQEFKPTTVMPAPRVEKPISTPAKPVSEPDYNTNIMEKVVKKVLENEAN